jgi:hypothetical protein
MFSTKVCHQEPLMYEATYCAIGSTVRKPFHFWFPDAFLGGKGWWIHCEVTISRIASSTYHVIAHNDRILPIQLEVNSHLVFHLVLIAIHAALEERILPVVMDWNEMDAGSIPS